MGYEVERFVKQVDEHLICPLCKKVFKDPTNCTEGHTFCKVCIDGWLQTPENYKTCPKDQKVHVIDKQALSPNCALWGVINNLEVFCHIAHQLTMVTSDPDVIAGAVQQTCGWTGKLQSLEKHRETCPFQQVKCSHVNCNRIMQRGELKDHEKRCDFRKVLCVECHIFLIQHELERHKENDCPQTLVPCPNQCTNIIGQVEKIKRKDAETHIINICARTIVDCPYKDQGCSVQDERQDVEKHVQENMADHMMLLAKQCSSLTKENQLLKSKLMKVKEEMRGLQVEFKSRMRYVWKILDYPSKARKYNNGTWIRSPTFWLCGYSWFLKLYPNGDKESNDFVSLYLVLSNEGSTVQAGKSFVVPSADISISSVRVQVLNQLQESNVSHNMEVNFGEDPNFGGTREMMCGIREVVGIREAAVIREVAGVSKLMKATDAVSSSYCNVADGSLTIICLLMD